MTNFKDVQINPYLIEDVVGDFKLRVKYETPYYIVEVIHIPSGEILMRPVQSSFEPLWGIDVVDMDNIMIAAEELCKIHENNPLKDVS